MYLFIHSAIWLALYQDNGTVAGVSITEMVTYVVLVQVAGAATEFDLGSELETLVKTGDLGSRLARPLDYRVYLFLTRIAFVISSMLTRGTAVVITALLFYTLQPPPSISHVVAYIALLAGGFVLSSTLNVCFAVTSLVRLEPKQFQWILMGLSSAASGALVPLWFYPDWLRKIVELLPLRLLRFVPVSMFLGHIDIERLPAMLAEQLVWSTLFVVVAVVIWRHGVRRMTGFGG